MPPKKNFRKRSHDEGESNNPDDSEDEQHRRLVLEEVKFLQKQRERKDGIPAVHTSASDGGAQLVRRASLGRGAGEGGEDREEQVLHDTFAQETAVTIEDPNMLNYVERELAKRKGKEVDSEEKEDKDPVDELFIIPDHLKVKKRNSEESSQQWTTGIAEIQLPIEFKLRNIEETEAAKKQLQEKRITGKTKSDPSIPSSYSADYVQRGRDYTEKLRKDHPELNKERTAPQDNEATGKPKEDSENNNNNNNKNKAEGGRREAATDELMLERFRRKEKYRVMRR